MSSRVEAVVVAAGRGDRLGVSLPKGFVPLAGRPLMTYSLCLFGQQPEVAAIVLVVPKDKTGEAEKIVASIELPKPVSVVTGGEERWQSVRNGVTATGSDTEWVLVHDAARPFATRAVIDALLDKRACYKCAITATSEVDTVRAFEDDRCMGTIDRSRLLRVGTPQLFQKASLLPAFERAKEMTPGPTDEAMLMEACGVEVGFAWGDPANFKVTTAHDIEMAEALLAQRGLGATAGPQ